MTATARDRLIVALDLPNLKEAERAVIRLGDAASFYKIGFELAFSGGIPFAADLARSGKKVFLDLKLHDIGNTVARATERAAELGVTFLTVHAFPQTMRAAAEGRAHPTSHDGGLGRSRAPKPARGGPNGYARRARTRRNALRQLDRAHDGRGHCGH